MIILSAIVDHIRRRKAYHQTYAMLSSMDDHMLRDIGICRAQIDMVARSGLPREKPIRLQTNQPVLPFGTATGRA